MDNDGNFKDREVVDCMPHILGRKQRGGVHSDIFKSQGNGKRKQVIWRIIYERKYDFSKGERGKFYRPDAKLNLPIYLDDKVFAFIEEIANKKGTDFSSVANQLLRSNMQLAEAIK